ncbi:hypothetical protein [Flavobacterium litorale]|uniref:Lipoprotein n=1 Tax=Flavobacterium litorale TaxID=2856519 RepID=A0ABX8VAP5_9FLAO|nr:hypothetical protein [Flavobacterium litorale]QYJ68106.1 hypothetical protein K1I41_11335 [Flavobacterium litorale]
MKKFILPTVLCVLTLSFFSCSTENDDIATAENATINSAIFQLKSLTTIDVDKAKQLYIHMMGTQEYIDYKNSIKSFNNKLGAANNVSFGTKVEWMNWMRNNIFNTSFKSIAQFETIYDTSIHKLEIMVNANSELYNFMQRANKIQISQIIAPEFNDTVPGGYPDVTNSCVDSCIDWCDSALDLIDEILSESIEIANQYAFENVSLYFQATFDANQSYNFQYESITLQLNQCIAVC